MIRNPRISIVTPSLNQVAYIQDAIESVRSQKYPNVEHLVIDGGSTDGTVELLRKYPDVRWLSEPDKGQADAVSKGFQMATGDILGWLNTDDYYLPGAFATVADRFAADPAPDVAYGEIWYVDKQKRFIRHKREHRFDYRVLLYYDCYIPSAATFYSRRIVDDGVVLSPDFRVCMDYEYFLRLATRGYSFVHIPKPLTAFRYQDTNAGKRYESLWPTELRIIRDQYGAFGISNAWVTAAVRRGLYHVYRGKRQLLRTFDRLTAG